MPVLPLGSVLLPGMPLSLRIFEERYLVMLSKVLAGTSEFGVVLIERGAEVGGGDQRFSIGTVAAITRSQLVPGWISVVAQGGRRFEVFDWLPDDPHPQAAVRLLPPLEWSEHLRPRLTQVQRTVRRSLARASEFEDQPWSADVGLAEDPVLCAWQLVGISPLGPLDQIALLRSETMEQLLDLTEGLAEAAAETLEMRGIDGLGCWAGGAEGERPEDR